jgi:DNA-binding transcriptional LysR family regulator
MLLSELGDDSNLCRAADRLHMTQPAASKLLREVGEAFGRELFRRSGRGIVPTEAGAVAIRRAKLILRDLEGTREELAVLGSSIRGRVTVGAYMIADPVLLPLTVIRLRSHQPEVAVAIEEGTSAARLLSALQRGEFDCTIGRLPATIPSDLQWIHLYDEPPVVVCGCHHELADIESVEIDHLNAYGWILPLQNHPLWRGLEAVFVLKGQARPRIELETGSLLTVITILQQTNALALLPMRVAHHIASTQPIAILPVDLGSVHPPIVTMLRSGAERGNALVAFLSALKSVANDINDAYSSVCLQYRQQVGP